MKNICPPAGHPVNHIEYTYNLGKWQRTRKLPVYYCGCGYAEWLSEAGFTLIPPNIEGARNCESFTGGTCSLSIYIGEHGWLAHLLFYGQGDTYVLLPDLPSYLMFKKELGWLPPMKADRQPCITG